MLELKTDMELIIKNNAFEASAENDLKTFKATLNLSKIFSIYDA